MPTINGQECYAYTVREGDGTLQDIVLQYQPTWEANGVDQDGAMAQVAAVNTVALSDSPAVGSTIYLPRDIAEH
jgi:hypothetical protein